MTKTKMADCPSTNTYVSKCIPCDTTQINGVWEETGQTTFNSAAEFCVS